MRNLIAPLFLFFALSVFVVESQETVLVKEDSAQYRKVSEHLRRYDLPITKEEKKDISYIITYLADKSLLSLLRHKSSLEAAGDRINHVHPLRFLMCVFTDEELTEGIKGIYKRGGWVWSDFSAGLKESLKEESQRNNLRDEQVIDFAKTIDVESGTIFPAIHNRKWSDFIVYLIKNVQK